MQLSVKEAEVSMSKTLQMSVKRLASQNDFNLEREGDRRKLFFFILSSIHNNIVHTKRDPILLLMKDNTQYCL